MTPSPLRSVRSKLNGNGDSASREFALILLQTCFCGH
jgi:hypothetical protein